MQDAYPVGLDQPRDLRIAHAVGRRECRQDEAAGPDRLPGRDRSAPQARGRQLALGLKQRELLEVVTASSVGLEHRSARDQRGRERLRVCVITMQVGEEPSNGPAHAGGDDGGKGRGGRPLAEGREHRPRVFERIDDHR